MIKTEFMELYEELSEINVDSISIDGVSSPEELMDWMDKNITYELANDDYGAENDPLTKTAQEVLETGTGHCAEQSYLEKEVLDNLDYETFLVMVKENSSKKDYGADGSAHVFLVYKEGKNYCWFEHSMQHARGIHKYTSLEALLQNVANQWWRYDENSDILEVRMMDKVITGVDNWGLAKECYKLPVEYTFDISDNIMESDVPLEEGITEEFDPPYNEQQVKSNYGEETYQRLIKDPAHLWRMRTGIELIHKEPSKKELERIWANWQLMSDKQKLISDKKSIQLFGKTNAENYSELIKLYESAKKENDLVFLSDKNMNGKTLTPRVPNNFLIKNGYEDSVTPRVCFADSIDKALMAISRNLAGEELYVHQPKNINKKAIYKPSIKEVPDVKITGEIWYKEPVELKCIGKILVTADDGKDGHKYTYGDKTAELYGWDWKWLEN